MCDISAANRRMHKTDIWRIPKCLQVLSLPTLVFLVVKKKKWWGIPQHFTVAEEFGHFVLRCWGMLFASLSTLRSLGTLCWGTWEVWHCHWQLKKKTWHWTGKPINLKYSSTWIYNSRPWAMGLPVSYYYVVATTFYYCIEVSPWVTLSWGRRIGSHWHASGYMARLRVLPDVTMRGS